MKVEIAPFTLDIEGRQVEHNAVIVSISFTREIRSPGMKIQAVHSSGGTTKFDAFGSPQKMIPLSGDVARLRALTEDAIIHRQGMNWRLIEEWIREIGSSPLPVAPDAAGMVASEKAAADLAKLNR